MRSSFCLNRSMPGDQPRPVPFTRAFAPGPASYACVAPGFAQDVGLEAHATGSHE
jgi:hypothetical protein